MRICTHLVCSTLDPVVAICGGVARLAIPLGAPWLRCEDTLVGTDGEDGCWPLLLACFGVQGPAVSDSELASGASCLGGLACGDPLRGDDVLLERHSTMFPPGPLLCLGESSGRCRADLDSPIGGPLAPCGGFLRSGEPLDGCVAAPLMQLIRRVGDPPGDRGLKR